MGYETSCRLRRNPKIVSVSVRFSYTFRLDSVSFKKNSVSFGQSQTDHARIKELRSLLLNKCGVPAPMSIAKPTIMPHSLFYHATPARRSCWRDKRNVIIEGSEPKFDRSQLNKNTQVYLNKLNKKKTRSFTAMQLY